MQFNTTGRYLVRFAVHFQKIYKKLSYNPLSSSILLLLVITNLQSLLDLNSYQGSRYRTVPTDMASIYLSGMCIGTEM